MGSQLLSIQKKVPLVFHFLFIFILQIFRGQADPLISDFKLPHDGPAFKINILKPINQISRHHTILTTPCLVGRSPLPSAVSIYSTANLVEASHPKANTDRRDASGRPHPPEPFMWIIARPLPSPLCSGVVKIGYE